MYGFILSTQKTTVLRQRIALKFVLHKRKIVDSQLQTFKTYGQHIEWITKCKFIIAKNMLE